jgi:tRNA(adenine34) deaminase
VNQTEADLVFMNLAIDQAQNAYLVGEVPVGAVVVREGKVISTGFNQPISGHDPTLHAEIVALRQAAQNLENYRLPDCELYVTLEPCTMCVGAMLHARLKRVVFGARDPRTGVAGSVLDIFAVPQLNHQTAVTGGIHASECGQILRDFFEERRRRLEDRGAGGDQDSLNFASTIVTEVEFSEWDAVKG